MSARYPLVLLHSGKGIISRLIKWQTDGDYNHASLLFSDGTVMESREWKGVVRTALLDVRRAVKESRGSLSIEAYQVAATLDEQRIRQWCEERLGMGYDYAGIFRFILRNRGAANNRYFCSEYVFDALEAGGISLLAGTPAHKVSPARLRSSPLLNFTHLIQPAE